MVAKKGGANYVHEKKTRLESIRKMTKQQKEEKNNMFKFWTDKKCDDQIL
jgi:hypothetical protein